MPNNTGYLVTQMNKMNKLIKDLHHFDTIQYMPHIEKNTRKHTMKSTTDTENYTDRMSKTKQQKIPGDTKN